MASTGEAWRLGRRPALDGLRGIAILLVIASHVWHPYSTAGPVGVTVFFVLSGFLITALLIEEVERTGHASLHGFYARRARRLLPALLLLVLLVGTLQTSLGTPLWSLGAVVLYVGNWVAAAEGPMGFFKHTWSLSVEEQFYVLWPLLLIAAAKLGGRRAVVVLALAGAVLSVVLRLWLWDGGAGAVRVRFGSDTNAAGLLIGCALAAWLHGRTVTRRNRPRLAAALVAGLSVVAASDALWNYTILAPLVAMAVTPAVVLLLVRDGGLGLFGHPALRYVGRRSYALYLWHAPLLVFATIAFGERSPLAMAVGVVATFAMAELSWRLVERRWLSSNRTDVRRTGQTSVAETVAHHQA